MPPKLFEIRNSSGEPIHINGMTLIPHSQAFIFNLPVGTAASFIWSRPVRVTVRMGDKVEENLKVLDPTRLAIFGLIGLTAFFLFVMQRLYYDRSR